MDENRNDINPNNNNQEEPSGYTVTPQDSFYTKRQGEIIQDAPLKNQEEKMQNRYNANIQNYNYASKYTPTKTPKKRYSATIVIISVILAAIVGAAGGAAAAFMVNNNAPVQTETEKNNISNVNITVDKTAESLVEAVAEKAGDSVVGIRTTTSVTNFFYGSSDQTGTGSGVVYSADGYIITNYHVIESVVESSSDAKIEVFIGASDTTPYEATVVGYSISTDLAVLKINASGLKPIEIGDSENLKVGQYVVTIGSPGGMDFRGSVTFGVISGLNRVVSSDSNVKLIQTDAAINPGNSGGALLDTKGKLVGINSSKIVSTEYEGMGFSIPVSTVIEKCDKIISKQSEDEAYIGISFSKKYTKDILAYYGFPNGAVVLSVDKDSPAQKAGIKRGDIITEFSGKEVESVAFLEEMISDIDIGKSVKIKLYRSGKYYSTEIKAVSNNAN